MSHAEDEHGRELFRHRKHKFIRVSVSFREDLLERVDRFMEEKTPYSSRSATLAILVVTGLHQLEGKEEKDTDAFSFL